MPELTIPEAAFAADDPGMNRWLAINIAAVMLYPRDSDKILRLHYIARCLVSSVPFLVGEGRHPEEEVGNIFYSLVQCAFGCWELFEEALLMHKLPAKGRGSLEERSKMGYEAGALFRAAFYHESSLRAATSHLSEVLGNSPELMQDIGYLSKENLLNNIWPQFKDVAHLWASLHVFELPEGGDKYIALDRATPRGEVRGMIPSGLAGIVGLANDYYDKSTTMQIRAKKAATPLINPKTAWRVVLV